MFKVVSGPRMNLLGLGARYGSSGQYGPLCSAAADSAYPLTNAYDGKPASPFKLAATSAGMYVTFPNNLVPNGDFEQGVAEWTTYNCTLTSETSLEVVWKGAKSARVVTSNAASAIYRKDVLTQAGQWLQLRAALKSDGTNAVTVYVHNLATDRYLQADGSWAVSGPVCSYTSATMAAVTPVTFQVEDLAATGGERTAVLEIYITGSAAGHMYFVDELLLVPGFNFVGVFGHGFQASTGLAVYGYGANYWHTPVFGNLLLGQDDNRALMRQSAHVVQTAMVYDPFPGVYFIPSGVWGSILTPKVPWVGELVVGQAQDLSENPGYPVAIEYRQPNVRYKTSGGSQWVMPRGSNPLRRVTISFAYLSPADYQAGRDALYTMSAGGAYPLILIPTETDPGEAIYGRLDDATTFRRDGFSTRVAEFIVQEEAFPWL